MTQSVTRSVRIHYRSAQFTGADDDLPKPSFENTLRELLKGPMGDDWETRACRIRDGHADEAMINSSEIEGKGVFLEIYHLDSRRDLAFLKKLGGKAKTASVLSRPVPADENAMGDAAYLLVIGNHVAAIEPLALKPGALTNYFNALFQKDNRLEADESWKLVPKVQVKDGGWTKQRGLTALEVRPHARLVGEGPSATPVEAGKRRSKPSRKAEARISEGGKLAELFEILGAQEADLDGLRESMSLDLGLEAKIVFQVRRNNRKTEARLETDDLSQAIASLQEHNDVALVSPDGKQRRGLTTLTEPGDVLETGGLLSLPHTSAALSSALMKWAGKGIIDLSGH